MMNRLKKSELDHKRFEKEATLTTHVRNYLSSLRGIMWYKASDRFNIGVSDFLACVNGRMVAIELKADKGKPSVHQLKFIKEVKDSGGVAGVCYTLGEVKALIAEAMGVADE